jgi:plastocyanin
VKKGATIFIAGAIAAFGVAACGSSNNNNDTTAASTTATGPSTTAAGTGATLDITASADKLAFDQTSLDAKAGTATINFDNPSSTPHDVVLEDSAGSQVGRTDLITQNKASFTAALKPGTYTYFCDVPGHEQAGMKGTITVK